MPSSKRKIIHSVFSEENESVWNIPKCQKNEKIRLDYELIKPAWSVPSSYKMMLWRADEPWQDSGWWGPARTESATGPARGIPVGLRHLWAVPSPTPALAVWAWTSSLGTTCRWARGANAWSPTADQLNQKLCGWSLTIYFKKPSRWFSDTLKMGTIDLSKSLQQFAC